jgi:hypothetical protein
VTAPDLAATLDDVVAFVRRYVVLTAAQAAAAALWVAHTHAFAAAEATPYLAISSAEPISGKTRLLEVFELLVARPWLTARVTAAVLPRRINKERSTLLLDESDAAFSGDKEYAETLRGVLNSGYREGGSVSVCVGQGANLSYATFSTFAPKAIAGLNKLPDTVQSRSIPIRLKRKAAGEQAERYFRRDARQAAEPVRDSLASLLEHYADQLADARPQLPAELGDRTADVWEPLFAIADLAGADWPERARAAAVELSTAGDLEDATVGVRLLTDTKAVFDSQAVDRVSSKGLVAALNELDEAPWGEWAKGRGLTQRTLANLLHKFDVRSKTVRFDDDTTAKGYHRSQFEDAFARYIDPSKRHNVTTRMVERETGDFEASHAEPCDASKNGANPHEQRDVTLCRFGTPNPRPRPLIGDPGYPLFADAAYANGHITAAELREQLELDGLVRRAAVDWRGER